MTKEKDMMIPEEPVELPSPEELVLKYEEEIKKTHEYYNKELDRLGRENRELKNIADNCSTLANSFYNKFNEMLEILKIINSITNLLIKRHESKEGE